jgi:hypothetical protein
MSDSLHLGDERIRVLANHVTMKAFVTKATDFTLSWEITVPCNENVMVHLKCMPFPHRDWKQFVGQRFVSTPSVGYLVKLDRPEPIHLEQSEPLDRHKTLDLEQSDIRFVARRGLQFDIDWRFLCSGRAGRVATTVTFTEIFIWLDEVRNKDAAKRRLAEDLDLSLFGEPEEIQNPWFDDMPQFIFKPIV